MYLKGLLQREGREREGTGKSKERGGNRREKRRTEGEREGERLREGPVKSVKPSTRWEDSPPLSE